MTETAAKEPGQDEWPKTASAKTMQVVSTLLFLVGGLPGVVGLGGLVIAVLAQKDLYHWLALFLGGLIALLVAVGLYGQGMTAVPTRWWRSPGRAVLLFLRRTALLFAVVVAGFGGPLFVMKLIGWFSDDAEGAHYRAPIVKVIISGECTTGHRGPLAATDDGAHCDAASWTIGGHYVNGELEATSGEISSGLGPNGPAHKDSVQAHVRGTTAYTPHRVHKPRSAAPFNDLPAWTWVGLIATIAGGLVVFNVPWSPESMKNPSDVFDD